MRASKILKIASRVLLVLVAVLNAGCSSENRAEMFRVLAEQGDAEAQNNLGKCYRDGIGVSQDYAEAAKWFQRSAEQGNADAQNNLGARYHTGTGVPLEQHENVFARFVKLEKFVQGTGLGLSICRIIAEKMQGRCYLDTTYPASSPDTDHGARFVFELPVVVNDIV